LLASVYGGGSRGTYNEKAACDDSCAWYDERSYKRCSFLNGIICMGTGMERKGRPGTGFIKMEKTGLGEISEKK